jgi:hypothetical protein
VQFFSRDYTVLYVYGLWIVGLKNRVETKMGFLDIRQKRKEAKFVFWNFRETFRENCLFFKDFRENVDENFR